MRVLVYGLYAWVLALSMLSAVQFQRIAESRAKARAENRAVWHSVVCTIQAQELASSKLTQAERTRVVQFWTTLLVKRVGTTPC